MPLYSFHPLHANGCAAPLLCAELPDRGTAIAYGRGVLAAHASAVALSVVQGERHVARLRSSPSASEAEQLRSSRACLAASLELLRKTGPDVTRDAES